MFKAHSEAVFDSVDHQTFDKSNNMLVAKQTEHWLILQCPELFTTVYLLCSSSKEEQKNIHTQITYHEIL